jgi:hypothetical protein
MSGAYKQTPLEVAKMLLEAMESPDLQNVLDRDEMRDTITQDDQKLLLYFLANLRTRRKKEREVEVKRQELQHHISEKGKNFINQETYELHQSLLMQVTESERQQLIRLTIDNNIFMFLKYMETYQPPFSDFLKIVVGLDSQIDKASFTELFVRVCKYQKIGGLKVTSEMIRNAIQFLVDNKKDDTAANGLLRIINYNSISLTTFPVQLLVKFENAYDQTILRFFKSLSL